MNIRDEYGLLGLRDDVSVPLVIGIVFLGLLGFYTLVGSIVFEVREDLDNLNCLELQEYILENNRQKKYAEHRFDWLGCEKQWIP